MNARLIDGEMVTVEDLIEKHRGVIWILAGKYKRTRLSGVMDWDDLTSIVHEALIIAFQKYEPEKNIKFTTYLDLWTKNRMGREMLSLEKLYVPEAAHRIVENMRVNDDMDLTADEIMDKYNCGRSTARALVQYFSYTFRSIHYSINMDDHDLTVEEVFGEEQDNTSVIVKDFLSTLTKEQLLLLSWRTKDLSQHEIGQLLGVTKQAISLKIKKIKQAWEAFENEQLISS